MKVFAALVIGGLGGVSVGAVLGFSAILLPKLGPEVTLTEKSWIGRYINERLIEYFYPDFILILPVIASLPNLSQLVGALVAGYAANKIGRKRALLLFCLPLISGWLTIIFSTGNSLIIMIGRLLKVTHYIQ